MKYVCVTTTFHDKLYEPGEEYEAVGNELKGNPCWKPAKNTKGTSSASSDDSSTSEAKSSE